MGNASLAQGEMCAFWRMLLTDDWWAPSGAAGRPPSYRLPRFTGEKTNDRLVLTALTPRLTSLAKGSPAHLTMLLFPAHLSVPWLPQHGGGGGGDTLKLSLKQK